MSKKKKMGYVRVSTMKDSQKDSPEHQEAFIRETATRMDMEIDDIYMDRDTATSIIAREDVQRMISDAKRGDIGTLFFTSLSRFSRDALDALSLKRILVNGLKIRVISIEDGYDSGIKDDELLFGIKSVVNQNTSGDISVSSRRGIRASAAAGNYTGSIPPYGYKKVVVDGRKTLEIEPGQAEVVKLIFDKYVNGGLGEKAVVNFLNGDNGQREPIPSYKGGFWGLSTVQRILQNENYTGYTIYGRHTTEVKYNDLSDLMDRGTKLVQKPKSEWSKTTFQTHEAIISEEIYQRAQEIRLIRGGGTRGGRRTFVNVFAKLVFCAECGAAMVTMSSEKRGTRYRYLMCSRRRRVGAVGCGNGKWMEYFKFRDESISEVLNLLIEIIETSESKGVHEMSTSVPQKNTTKDKAKLEKKITDNRKLLFEIRRQSMLKEIDAAQYEFEKEIYEKEIDETEKRLTVIDLQEKHTLDREKNIKVMKATLNELGALKSYDDIDKTRILLLKVIKRIEVDKDGEITIQSYI